MVTDRPGPLRRVPGPLWARPVWRGCGACGLGGASGGPGLVLVFSPSAAVVRGWVLAVAAAGTAQPSKIEQNLLYFVQLPNDGTRQLNKITVVVQFLTFNPADVGANDAPPSRLTAYCAAATANREAKPLEVAEEPPPLTPPPEGAGKNPSYAEYPFKKVPKMAYLLI